MWLNGDVSLCYELKKNTKIRPLKKHSISTSSYDIYIQQKNLFIYYKTLTKIQINFKLKHLALHSVCFQQKQCNC